MKISSRYLLALMVALSCFLWAAHGVQTEGDEAHNEHISQTASDSGEKEIGDSTAAPILGENPQLTNQQQAETAELSQNPEQAHNNQSDRQPPPTLDAHSKTSNQSQKAFDNSTSARNEATNERFPTSSLTQHLKDIFNFSRLNLHGNIIEILFEDGNQSNQAEVSTGHEEALHSTDEREMEKEQLIEVAVEIQEQPETQNIKSQNLKQHRNQSTEQIPSNGSQSQQTQNKSANYSQQPATNLEPPAAKSPVVGLSSPRKRQVSELSILFTILSLVSDSIVQSLPSALNMTLQQCLQLLIAKTAQLLLPIMSDYYQLYKILSSESKPAKTARKVYYQNNYANIYGGAKITMKSSPNINSVNAILEDSIDKYMYTEEELPLSVIVGLNEEIAIDSIIIQSFQMYSRITKEFKVEGKFTMEDKKWVYLGTFKAENVFGDQEFYTERKIVRYIKLTFLSAYGNWSYFTLTQIKIRGKNLFADALKEIEKKSGNSDENMEKTVQRHKWQQQQHEAHHNMCENEQPFQAKSEQPHESNLIAKLISKIDMLESHNTNQGKQIETLSSKLVELSSVLVNKTQENQAYEQIMEQYRGESARTHYLIVFSMALSAVTIASLLCLCFMRRRELQEADRNVEKLFMAKKSSGLL